MKLMPSWEKRKRFKAGGWNPSVQTVKAAVRSKWTLSWASVLWGQSFSTLGVLGHLDLQVLILI